MGHRDDNHANLWVTIVISFIQDPCLTAMLCPTCTGALRLREGRIRNDERESYGREMGIHHKTARDLRDSALNIGCYTCRIVWDDLTPSEQNQLMSLDEKSTRNVTQWFLLDLDDMIPNSIASGLGMRADIPTLGFIIGFGDGVSRLGNRDNPTSVFVLWPSSELKDYSPQASYPRSTESPNVLETAEWWLRTCSETHHRCNQAAAFKWVPTRLIDIGSSQATHVKLVCTANVEIPGVYATLSHRWGSANICQLFSASITQFQKGILLSDLPKTFLDAFTICQRLGIRYIWIDSLCIVQDDRQDWLREAGLMHKVYSSSFLNISASGAFDTSEGLFFDRDQSLLLPTTVNLSRRGGPEIEYQVLDIAFWKREVSSAPLNHRAWVVQERLLAPRVLHFGRHQLLWECHEMDVAEQYPNRLPQILQAAASFKGIDPPINGRHRQQLAGLDPDPRLFAYNIWERIVEAYTACQLTKAEDKLIALSGIAKHMQPILGNDEYLAGLWRKFLPSQLLWTVNHGRQSNHEPSLRPEVYRAPSWSWASVDGEISVGATTENGILVEVLDAQTTPVTADPTGQISAGYIVLRGLLKKTKLKMDEFGLEWIMTINNLQARKSTGTRHGPTVHIDVPMETLKEDLYIMGFRQWVSEVSQTWQANGLIFQLIKDGDARGSYRRIGFYSVTDDEFDVHGSLVHDSRGELMSLLRSAVDPEEAQYPCQAYDSVYKHTIVVL